MNLALTPAHTIVNIVKRFSSCKNENILLNVANCRYVKIVVIIVAN